QKLDLSANEMGALLGVTGQSVYKWEKGTARPRASQLKAIAAVRKMGKKQVLELLTG
ncbi:MAG: XRE family transcriptional regulator, partial [Betaproteobacteria bacterium]|nr:XRE family transcriptional regulator [Betaproteobacteria bacterium]